MQTKAEIENIEALGQGFKCPCGPWVSALTFSNVYPVGGGAHRPFFISTYELTPNQIYNKISECCCTHINTTYTYR